MKYFKKFLLLGIFTLLGVSFCSAYQEIHLDLYGSSSNRVAKPSSVSMPYVICGNNGITLYTCLTSSTPNCNSFTFSAPSSLSSWGNSVSSCYYYNYTTYDVNQYLYASADTTVAYYVLTDCSNSSSSCDYSEYESQISTLQSQLSTATGSLATCQSNLSIATGSLATCQSNLSTATGSLATCQSNLNTATGSLATCQNDLTSCQNNSSSSSSSCDATGYISDYISGNILFSGSKSFGSAGYTNMFNYLDYGAGTYCLKFSSTSPQTLSMGFANGGTTAPTNLYSLYNDQYGNWICLYGNKPYLNVKLNSSSNTINYEVYKLTDLLGTQFQCPVQSLSGYILESSVNSQYCVNNGLCPSCPDQYTSLQCQEEYNLIPINDINENYCTLNFDLISPSDCPSSPSGSGTSRSALYVNNVQYLGSPSIYVNIPEIIDRNYTYNSGNMILDVEGYNVNTGYMADILTVQEYHPSSEDFTVAFVSFLTLVLPYVIVTLFVIFVRKLLRKIFKS